MKNIFWFLILIFPYTDQLSCLTNCPNIKVSKGELYKDPLLLLSEEKINRCKYEQRPIRCYGRIMTYYNKMVHPEYISYSLGAREHIIEKEIESIANQISSKLIIYFLFIFESFNELIITTYIICQTSDDCALNYIKNFFYFYQKQKNPSFELSPFFHSNNHPISKLICYDYDTKQSSECLSDQYSTCIFRHPDISEQGCYSDLNIKLEYAFMITSLSNKSTIEKVFQLIICNTNNCNDESIIKTIENIIYNHTFGTMISINNSNQIQFDFFLFFIYLIRILFYDI